MTKKGWISAAAVVAAQRRIVAQWHEWEKRISSWDDACRVLPVPERGADLRAYAASIAHINTFQWHEEDKARDPSATDAVIAAIKRSIDASNQRRVNEIERLDVVLAERLARAKPPRRASAVLSSETPGSMVDRLSILVLKLYHTEESLRAAADEAARARFAARLAAQEEQLADLSACFDALMSGLPTGQRRFKLYFQFKMYNDAETNPYMRRK